MSHSSVASSVFPLDEWIPKEFFPLWISWTQWNSYSVKCTDFLSAATSSLLSQRKRRKGVVCVDYKGQWHFKMIEFERFFSLGRGNMPNPTLGTKEDVRRRNSFILYWWEWCWCCSYLLAFLKCHISGLSYEKQFGTWVPSIFQIISSTDCYPCAKWIATLMHSTKETLGRPQRLQKRITLAHNHPVQNKNIFNLIWLFIACRESRHRNHMIHIHEHTLIHME